jgi:hypothetical protein
MRRALLSVALLLAAGQAHAQATTALDPPALERYLRWGPVRVRPGFTLTNLGYDDNVFYRTAGTARPAEGDWYATLSPRAEGVVLLGHRAFATFDGKLDYTAYKDNSEINYTNSSLASRVTLPFRGAGLFWDVSHRRTQDRPLDLQDARPVRRERSLGAGMIVKAGWRTEFEIGSAFTRFSNSDDNFLQCRGAGGSAPCYTIGDLLDRTETVNQVRARYRLLGRTRLTLEARLRDLNFGSRDARVARDGRETRLLPGIDFGEGGRLTGTLRVGRSRLDIDATPGTDYAGLVGEARLSYRVGGGLTLQAGGQRDVAFSIYSGNEFYVRRATDVRAIKYFNRLFGVEAGYGRGRLDFPSTVRTDRLATYDGGVRLRLSETALGRRVEYTLKWVHTRVDSSLNGLDQSRSTVGVGAVIGY